MKLLKKTVLAVSVSGVMSTSVIAGTQASNIGYGPVGGMHSVFSLLDSPANNEVALQDSDFALGLSGTVSAEVQGFENLFEDFSYIQDNLGATTQADADVFVSNYDSSQITGLAEVHVPVLIKTTDYGNISLEYGHSRGITAQTFSHNDIAGGFIPDVQLGSDLSYIQQTEIALGYAREMKLPVVQETFGEKTRLTYGIKAKAQQIGANKAVYNFNRSLVSTVDAEKDLNDIADVLNEDVATSSSFTADIGVRLDTANWGVGATIKNIIPVEIKYDMKNSDTAMAQVGDTYDTKFTMNPYGIIDISLYTEDKNWTASTYVETNSHTTLLNTDEHKIGVHASYATDTAYLPDFRVGVDKNLTGSEFTTYAVGLTAGFVSLDVSTSQLSFSSGEYEDFAGAASLSVEFEF